MARTTFNPTPAKGEGAIPAVMAFTSAKSSASLRTTAAVNTGKLLAPLNTITALAFAAASN
jgi:hypothetical protein